MSSILSQRTYPQAAEDNVVPMSRSEFAVAVATLSSKPEPLDFGLNRNMDGPATV
jgi:hypothetical protein